MKKKEKTKKERLHLLDTLRGIAILGMVFIHATFFLPDILGVNPPYADSFGYEMFCQAVRIGFIFLSGFCCRMGKHPVRRGLIVSAAGLAITLVSVIAKMGDPILFGVLTLIGASMILASPFKKLIGKKNAPALFFVFLILFLATVRLSYGYFGIFRHPVFHWPKSWYAIENPVLGPVLAFLGLPQRGFFSSDYFPLMPWFFMFMAGFSLEAWIFDRIKTKKFMSFRMEPVTFLGKYSLWVYFIHLPVILGILYAISYFRRQI